MWIMTSMVLVHGSWLGGWVWERVIPSLAAAGHDAYAPDLPGLASDADHVTEEIDVMVHAAALRAFVDEHDLRDVVVVGHSYGGMVAQAAAAGNSRVAHIVYVDAFLAEDRESAFDLLPWLADAFHPVDADRPWLIAPIDPVGLGVTEAADVDWLTSRMTPMPVATHDQPFRASSGTVPGGHYLYCEALPLMEGMLDRARSRRLAIVTLPTAHMPMVTHPDLLAATLLGILDEYGAASEGR